MPKYHRFSGHSIFDSAAGAVKKAPTKRKPADDSDASSDFDFAAPVSKKSANAVSTAKPKEGIAKTKKMAATKSSAAASKPKKESKKKNDDLDVVNDDDESFSSALEKKSTTVAGVRSYASLSF